MEDLAGFVDNCEFSFPDQLATQRMAEGSCGLGDALRIDNNHTYNIQAAEHHQGNHDHQHRSMYPQSPTVQDASSIMQPLHHPRTAFGWKQPPSTTPFPLPSHDHRVPPCSAPKAAAPRILSFEAYRDAAAGEAEDLQGSRRVAAERGLLISQRPRTVAPQERNRGGGGRQSAVQHEHIIAERKRREKLSQQFIALSAIVPGLKKMDKASILGDAINYMKELQKRVQYLEEQAAGKAESFVVVKKFKVRDDADESCYSDGSNSDGGGTSLTTTTMSVRSGSRSKTNSLPVIEAKVMDRAVLLRIQYERQKGVLVRVLAEVERLGLSVVNSNVMPFAGSILDMTVVAQMENGFSMPAKDLVRRLNVAITQIV